MSETSKCGNCGHPVHHEHTDGICGTMTYMADGSDEWDEDLFCYCADLATPSEPRECEHVFDGKQGWLRALLCRKCNTAYPVDDPAAIHPCEPERVSPSLCTCRWLRQSSSECPQHTHENASMTDLDL